MDTLSSHDVSNSNWALGRVNGGNLAESPTNRRRQSDGQMRSIIREKNRLRVAQKRASLSEQEKIQRLELERQKAASRRLTETPMRRELRKEKQRFRAALRRKNETLEQRELRLKIGREKANERRQNESPVSREKRLQAGRERVAIKRSSKKNSHVLAPDGIGALTYLGSPLKHSAILDPSLSAGLFSVTASNSLTASLPHVVTQVGSESSLSELPSSSDDQSVVSLTTSKASSTRSPSPSCTASSLSAEEDSDTMSQKSQKQMPQLLSMGAIAAQEQQVTALRELLKQEEGRLCMLKKVKGDQKHSHLANSKTEGGNHVGGVIQSTASRNSTASSRSRSTARKAPSHGGPGMSSRLQQLVESVAVDQISSQTSKLKQSFQQQQQQLLPQGGKQMSNKSEVITIHDSSAKISPPPLTSVQSNAPMVLQMSAISSGHQLLKLDDAAVTRAIENSRRYKEFVMKQANSKRAFQKQIEKRIASAPYPKTFRQVWPIIPVYDPTFIKNLGLETVTMFFDPKWRTELSKPPPASKIKPICNQCGCDFASAWQIRKNNAKQVLLCESCDFSNLKLLQRTKLATQLKELVETIRTDDEKFSAECEEARKQMVALEKQAILSSQGIMRPVSNAQKSVITQQSSTKTTQNHKTEPVSVLRSEVKGNPGAAKQIGVIPSLLPSQVKNQETGRSASSSPQRDAPEHTRKRRLHDADSTARKAAKQTTRAVPKAVVKPSPNLDHTLSRITEQLLRKQVDDKCKGQSTDELDLVQSSPIPAAPVLTTASNERPTVVTCTPTPQSSTSTPDTGSRKNRRKGTPRQNRHLSSSSATD